jgi:hypothetical protein
MPGGDRTRARGNRFDSIANQMMKGCNRIVKKNNVAGTDQEMEDFKRVYGNTITYLEESLPKTLSVAICGALGKAILWHGKKEIQPFVEAVAKREFKGQGDPCLVLWEWLIRHNKRNDTEKIYRRTVTAIRFFLRGAQVKSHLKPALDDIFEWQNNYRVMYQSRRNQHTVSKSVTKQTDEAIQADVEDALSGCPT